MPRELIMFRYHFENNGTTLEWKTLYRALNEEQKKELMEFVSHTAFELENLPCPEQFKAILPYYFIKYKERGKIFDNTTQLSFIEDSDIVLENDLEEDT